MAYWNSKVVLITGGSSGFGKVLASEFARCGAEVVISARGESQLNQTAAEIGPHVAGFAADVTRDDQVKDLFDRTIAKFGRLDALINNAGRSARGEVAETTAAQFQELLEVNFLAAVRCTQLALPHLLSSRGHVVFMGSLASKVASSYLGAYPASKFPLGAYAQQLRLELGPSGLHTLLVCPGPIRRDDEGKRYDQQSQGLPESARRPGGGVRIKGIDPVYLAQRIAKACERRTAELIVPSSARWLAAISQLWPTLGDRIIRRMTR
jgi:NAD(P)-dependent dehydrogenase (short-subunit alcohol dehydrogenase family)